MCIRGFVVILLLLAAEGWQVLRDLIVNMLS